MFSEIDSKINIDLSINEEVTDILQTRKNLERLDNFIRHIFLNENISTSYNEIFNDITFWAANSGSVYSRTQIEEALHRYNINSHIIYNLQKVKTFIKNIVPLFIENKLKDLHKVIVELIECTVNLDDTPDKYKIFIQQIHNTYKCCDEILEDIMEDNREEEAEDYITIIGG